MYQKYQNRYYWEELVHNRKMQQTFNNKWITDQSVFFQGIIYNSAGRRKLIEDVFHFTSLDALAGYLHYIFLPTVFMSFTNLDEGITIPLGIEMADLIAYVGENEFVQYHNYTHAMYQLMEFSEQLLVAETEQKQLLIKHIEGLFNYSFQMDRDAYAMLHVYHSTQELGEYFSALYQIDGDKQLGNALFYHRTGLRKADWQQLCQHAGDNVFSSRKFMNCIANLLHTS